MGKFSSHFHLLCVDFAGQVWIIAKQRGKSDKENGEIWSIVPFFVVKSARNCLWFSFRIFFFPLLSSSLMNWCDEDSTQTRTRLKRGVCVSLIWNVLGLMHRRRDDIDLAGRDFVHFAWCEGLECAQTIFSLDWNFHTHMLWKTHCELNVAQMELQ